MILRRVIEHFRKQEWTAIAIDFLIVVIGVFVGLQVNNWNSVRAAHADEKQLLMRLHQDARALVDIQTAEYQEHLPRVEALSAVHPLLFDETPPRALTETECRLIGTSHWLPAPTDELPVLEEGVSTGRINLISSESVKENLRNYMLVRARARRQYAEAVNELFRLNARHPDAIWYVRKPVDDGGDPANSALRAGAGYRWANGCDLEKMRGDRSFLAEYVDNVSRLNSYAERYEKLIDVLSELETTLAAELGLPALSGGGAAL